MERQFIDPVVTMPPRSGNPATNAKLRKDKSPSIPK